VNWQDRTRLLLGEERMQKLHRSHVLVAGLGGVGSMLAEMLCRAGIGTLSLVDGDVIQASNRNRQILALQHLEGKAKTEAMAERLRSINPEVKLHQHTVFLKDDIIPQILNQPLDYVADAIDTLSPKLYLIRHSLEKGHRLVSAMGAGGKMDPEQIHICPVEKSYGCRLAFIVRKRLHRMGIREGFDVVFSAEAVKEESVIAVEEENKKTQVGTISYMPPLFGAFMASVIIRKLITQTETESEA
jgi:tRNA A37 threonylcarbamoyladenosine dehydratase